MNGSSQKKILIADDEATVRALVKRLLGKSYVILEAEDGEEAVQVANSQKPDLVLMDILMPKMDGLTACHVIKSSPATKDIPVVMLTAVDYELNRKLSQEVMGAQDYITKPFDSQTLNSAIDRFVARA
jgi:two-component system alkaline phosphatase synthesis response regulator PhoP